MLLVDLSSWLVNQPPPLTYPPRNKGLIFGLGLIKGNQWLISPDHKAGYFWGVCYVALGGGWLTIAIISLSTKNPKLQCRQCLKKIYPPKNQSKLLWLQIPWNIPQDPKHHLFIGRKFKGQLDVPLTMYPWYLIVVFNLGILGDKLITYL